MPRATAAVAEHRHDFGVISLAIQTATELLQPSRRGRFDVRSTCIARVTVASGTVLEGLPIEFARHDFLSRIGVDGDAAGADAAFQLLGPIGSVSSRARLGDRTRTSGVTNSLLS